MGGKKTEKQLLFIAEPLRGIDLILIVWLLKRNLSSFEERYVTQSLAGSSLAITLAFPCVSRLLERLVVNMNRQCRQIANQVHQVPAERENCQ